MVGGECYDFPIGCEEGEATGGSYPSPGIWRGVGPLDYDELVFGVGGPYIHYYEFIDGDPNDRRGIVILPDVDEINFATKPELRWVGAQIPWGLWQANNLGEWIQPWLYILPG